MLGPACVTGCENASPVTSPTPDVVVQVEYVRVDGQPCLQPQVIRGIPTDHDLVAAQKRWLTQTYPGYRLARQTHVLTLAPQYRRPEDRDAPSTESDTLEFETRDGKPISECFALTVANTDASK
jgi:hypothetical protein